ncbi:MAG: family 16 glycoside hydrolase [Planctomycetota bacterium]
MANSLTLDDRKQAIDTLAFTMDRTAGEAMLDVALAGPEDTRDYARWWIRFRDTNDWSAWQLAAQIETGDRANAKLLYESPVMKDGIAIIDVDLRNATRLYLNVDDTGNGNSCDWANWVDGKLSGPGGEMLLGDLPWTDAVAAWGQVRKNKNCNDGPLVVASKTYEQGIGTHANSEISYALPPGKIDRLRVSVGPDQKGVSQNGGTSIRFRVYAEVPPDPTRFAKIEARLLDKKLSAKERKDAAAELCSTRDGGLYVLSLADKGRFDAESKAMVSEVIFLNPDLAVRALASEHFQRGASSMPPIPELEKLHGDAKNGERVFFGATASCAKCHTLSGRGGDIGPDLTPLRKKYAAGAMFDAILNPSAGIAFGYDTWMFATDDERVVSGFLLADGEKVILKDTAGMRTMLEAKEIVARRKAKVSAMPDNVSAGLSAQELADVVAFLLEDREAPHKIGEPVPLFNGKDFSGWTFYLDQPGAKLTDVWSFQDGVLDCKGNPIGYLRTEAEYENFVIELDWRFPAGGEPGNSGVLMRRVGADKVWPKSIEAQLQHRHAGDIWNIDEVPMVVDRGRTDGRHTEKLAPCNEVPQGEWNHYKITLDRGNLTLEVNGTVQNTATWVERVPGNICLQSEGSRIQFMNIVLRRIE